MCEKTEIEPVELCRQVLGASITTLLMIMPHEVVRAAVAEYGGLADNDELWRAVRRMATIANDMSDDLVTQALAADDLGTVSIDDGPPRIDDIKEAMDAMTLLEELWESGDFGQSMMLRLADVLAKTLPTVERCTEHNVYGCFYTNGCEKGPR